MSRQRYAMIVCALAVLVPSGCAEQSTPPSVMEVDLELTVAPATGSPAQPVVADSRARNVGNTMVWHCQGCGCGNGFEFTVLGPDGIAVAWRDPNAPVTLCADWPRELAPGGDIGDRLLFNGTLYVTGSPGVPSATYMAKAGTYTVIARFRYATDVQEESIAVERTTTFTWAP